MSTPQTDADGRTETPQSSRHIEDSISRLEEITGDGTELITLTVPPETALKSVHKQIQSEHANAEHIKSDTTRKHVQKALNKINRILSQYTSTPDNGLIIYAGVVNGDLFTATFDTLTQPVQSSQYQCDDHFDTTPLQALVEPSEWIGLVIVERGGAALGMATTERTDTLYTTDSQVMGKTRAGGQSAQRFARERDRQKHEFFTNIGQTTATTFDRVSNEMNSPPIAIAIGGTLGTANEFTTNEYLPHTLQNKICGTYTAEYANETGIEQLGADIQHIFEERDQQELRDTLETFYTGLTNGDQPVTYGSENVERAIEYGAVDTLLIASSIDEQLTTDLTTAAEQQGGTICTVTPKIDAGKQFIDAFGGIGALLRFNIE